MKKFYSFLAISLASLTVLSSCGVQKQAQSNFLNSLQVSPSRHPQQSFYDLTCGVQITVIPTQPTENITKYTHHLSGKSIFSMPTINYVRSMGFKDMNPGTDYKMFITVETADVNGWNGECSFGLSIILKDSKGKEVFNQRNIFATSTNKLYLPNGLLESYTLALEKVDWSRIASFLRIEQRPADEPQKIVRGMGDTALEQTIIRWDVQSRPQGADLFWRVVSKTPEVKSTNNKYLNAIGLRVA